jgi:hypothetical protein
MQILEQKGENISLRAKFQFPFHVVKIDLPIQTMAMTQASLMSTGVLSSSECDSSMLVISGSQSQVVHTDNGVVSGSVSTLDTLQHDSRDKNMTMSVYDTISLGLDFSHGMSFAKDTRRNFHLDVHPSDDSGHFIIVVSFGRAQFHLKEDIVGLALEAVLGGFCDSFKVSHPSVRVFSSGVSSKRVGFQILKLRIFIFPKFKCYFHLWGRGGPNWQREFKLWQQECDEEWTLISPSKHRVQLGMSALKKTAPKSILHSTPQIHCKKLNFANSLSYEACHGYQDPNVSKKVCVLIPDSLTVTEKLW